MNCYKPFKTQVLELLKTIIDNQNRMETNLMSKLDDIEAAVDVGVVEASDDLARMTDLVNKAMVMIKDLQNGTDPAHADAIIAKLNTLKDTFQGAITHLLDSLDAVVNPPAP